MTHRAACSARACWIAGGKLVAVVLLLLAGLVLLSGCAPSLRKVGELNMGNVRRVHVGDIRNQVVMHMGTTTVIAKHGQEVSCPYRTRTFENSEGARTEILYYYTGSAHVEKEQDHTITMAELTPIVLEWGVVVGVGWQYLRENREKYSAALESEESF